MNIQDLPNEVLILVFDHLDAMGLIMCTKVNKWFRILSLDRSLWRSIKTLPREMSKREVSKTKEFTGFKSLRLIIHGGAGKIFFLVDMKST